MEPFNKGELQSEQASDNPSQDNDILDGHDIALIRLSREVTLSDTVWPACLPGGFSWHFAYTVFPRPCSGSKSWGRGSGGDCGRIWHHQHHDQGVTSKCKYNQWTPQAWADILQMANIKVVSASSCQAPANATSSFLWDIRGDQICARGKEKESSRNCFRDSCQVSLFLKQPV